MAHLTSSRTRPEGARVSHKLARGVVALAAVGSTAGLIFGAAAGTPAAAASPSSDTSTYVPGTPRVATITNGTSQTPWNTSQGDPGDGAAYQSADLLPTYTPGGHHVDQHGCRVPRSPSPTWPSTRAPAAAPTAAAPYPSGVVGTPGPLDGYCGSGNQHDRVRRHPGPPAQRHHAALLAPPTSPTSSATPTASLTGYFDYRPKDADEARGRGQLDRQRHRTGPTRARPSSRTPATARRPTPTTTARATPT